MPKDLCTYYICNVHPCKNREVSSASWKRHSDSHDPSTYHTCTRCSKVFKQRSALKTHMNTHTGAKPYGCGACVPERRFSDPASFSRHKKSVHGKGLPCPVQGCSTIFRRSDTLKAHIGHIHREDPKRYDNFFRSTRKIRKLAVQVNLARSAALELPNALSFTCESSPPNAAEMVLLQPPGTFPLHDHGPLPLSQGTTSGLNLLQTPLASIYNSLDDITFAVDSRLSATPGGASSASTPAPITPSVTPSVIPASLHADPSEMPLFPGLSSDPFVQHNPLVYDPYVAALWPSYDHELYTYSSKLLFLA